MEQKKKALGRGLEQLFSTEVLDFESFENNIMESASESDIKRIPVSEIRPNPYQPRKIFDEEAIEELSASIKEYGVIQNERHGKMFAYETDGKGNYVLMDDANSPSLLAAPYLGYIKADNELYKNTRSFVLSNDNPWYFEGRAAKGVGSPHTGIDKIWHIALSMQALTSSNPEEIKECINMLTTTDAGTKLMHESFYKHDATDFTRPWFAWANSLFAELMIRLAEGK